MSRPVIRPASPGPVSEGSTDSERETPQPVDIVSRSSIANVVTCRPARRHSSIGDLSPAEFESRHMADADAA